MRDRLSWIKRKPSKSLLPFIVISVHIFFLIAAAHFSTAAMKPQRHKTLRVTTKIKTLSPSLPPLAAQRSIDPKKDNKKELPKVHKAPSEKRINPPAEKKIKAEQQVKEKKQEANPLKTKPAPINAALLQELEESIAKIEGKRDKIDAGKKLNVPSELKKEASSRTQEILGMDKAPDEEIKAFLIKSLHHSLHLPDFGEVKVQLTLRSDGSVAS
ncbi:MAG: hypothetical protein ACM3JI_02005, partial [Anaerolineae bacterium]